jgi:hypothetical protein
MKMNLMLHSQPQIFAESPRGGLRIREIGARDAEIAAQRLASGAAQAPEANANAPIVTSLSDTGKFAAEFLRRCQAASKGDEEASCMLTESLVNAATEISSRLGKDKGAEFLNTVLEYTERGLTENRLAGAVSEFFEQFRQEAIADDKLCMKLIELTGIFNDGLDILIDKETILPERQARGEKPGLAFAMNNFFATDFTVSEEGGRVTTQGFNLYFDQSEQKYLIDRIELTEGSKGEWLEDGPGGPGYYVMVKTDEKIGVNELPGAETNEALSKVADYLRTGIGNERAAAFLETLSADATVMEAITATVAIVAMEDGFDKAAEYVNYLNGGLKNTINSVATESIFGGWILHAQEKSSKPAGSGLTMHSGGPDGLDGIFAKGHFGLDYSWRSKSGVGLTVAPIDLHEIYSRLR